MADDESDSSEEEFDDAEEAEEVVERLPYTDQEILEELAARRPTNVPLDPLARNAVVICQCLSKTKRMKYSVNTSNTCAFSVKPTAAIAPGWYTDDKFAPFFCCLER